MPFLARAAQATLALSQILFAAEAFAFLMKVVLSEWQFL